MQFWNVVTMARIGTSGWSYDHWRGVLYEPGLTAGKWLERYASEFDTVELNSSFYRWPSPTRFGGWRSRLPDGFRMSVKAPRGLTHGRRLFQPEAWIARIAEGLGELGSRQGPLLVQLPPDLERDDRRLSYFLEALPDHIRPVMEFRHPSWTDDAVFDLLEGHAAAYCVMSGAGLPCILRATARLVYVRLHGPDHHHLYAGSYSGADMEWWADRVREWESAGHQVHVYFNNDGEGRAVRNAWVLRELLA